jgi:hypothetical protein
MSDEPVGGLGEEAAKLLGALGQSLGDWAKDHARDVDEHLATGAAECTYCPICRTVHAVRTASPEVKAQLLTSAQGLLEAATGLLAAATQHTEQRPTSVQRIDLDEDGDDEAVDEPEEEGWDPS